MCLRTTDIHPGVLDSLTLTCQNDAGTHRDVQTWSSSHWLCLRPHVRSSLIGWLGGWASAKAHPSKNCVSATEYINFHKEPWFIYSDAGDRDTTSHRTILGETSSVSEAENQLRRTEIKQDSRSRSKEALVCFQLKLLRRTSKAAYWREELYSQNPSRWVTDRLLSENTGGSSSTLTEGEEEDKEAKSE